MVVENNSGDSKIRPCSCPLSEFANANPRLTRATPHRKILGPSLRASHSDTTCVTGTADVAQKISANVRLHSYISEQKCVRYLGIYTPVKAVKRLHHVRAHIHVESHQT